MRQMYWHSVLLHDFYARFNVQKNLDMNLKISNLTDRYYMDPMSKIPVPGPGRTLSLGLRARF
jgi:hemoglobin/transferrin/lactoferrin receptor protein